MHALEPLCCYPPLSTDSLENECSISPTSTSQSPQVAESTENLGFGNFIDKYPSLTTQQVHEFLSYNYKSFFLYLKMQNLEGLLKCPQIELGLESLFWTKPWTLFVFLDFFPTWDFQNFSCSMDGCLQKSFEENPYRFRHYLNRAVIANFISQKCDFEKLKFYANCKGFWYLFLEESATPLIKLFQKMDVGFSTKAELIVTFKSYFPLVHPRGQKSFFSIDLFFRPFLWFCKNDEKTVADLFKPEVFASETEKKLFLFPFCSDEIQRQILADILLQQGEMGTFCVPQTVSFRDLSLTPHYLIPHSILHYNTQTIARSPLRLIQIQMIEDLKRHLVFLIKDLHKSSKNAPLEDLHREWHLSQSGFKKISTSTDLKSSLLQIPIGEFMFVVKYNPELREMFREEIGFHRAICEILSLDEEHIFEHHTVNIENLFRSFF